MTPEQIHLVRSSWEKLTPRAGETAATFYRRLFELDPDLEPMFQTGSEHQGAKLMLALTTVVHSLDNLEPLLSKLKALGLRHDSYGVRAADYTTAGNALLSTLDETLGPEDFDPAAREAWAKAYATLAAAMQAPVSAADSREALGAS